MPKKTTRKRPARLALTRKPLHPSSGNYELGGPAGRYRSFSEQFPEGSTVTVNGEEMTVHYAKKTPRC